MNLLYKDFCYVMLNMEILYDKEKHNSTKIRIYRRLYQLRTPTRCILNLMDQYRPSYKAFEYKEVYDYGRELGLF